MTNTDIKSYLERAKNIENELKTLRDDKKELNAEMKENGIDLKAFKIALKEVMTPMDAGTKTIANTYLTASGQGDLFA